MRKISLANLVLVFVVGGCGVSYPVAAPSKTSANPVVQAKSLKGDLEELLDRAIARDDVMIAEAAKAKSISDQARLTRQAYLELFSCTTQVQERAGKFGLNPLEAKKKKAILEETTSSLWKLRYLDKEGGAKAGDDESRLAHYDRLHTEALASLNRVQYVLKGRI